MDGRQNTQGESRQGLEDLKTFRFRKLHPQVLLGTASDRYAGWIGQIYAPERYLNRLSKRSKTFKDKAFVEETLPVDSLEEYFEHFSILEIDFTFYQLLLDENEKPTQNYFLLKKYGSHLKEKDSLFLKVPQLITARKVHQGAQYGLNENYLNPELFIRRFYQPAREVLGSKIRGFIFEQEYHRRQERIPIDELAASLAQFFESIPEDDRYHLELRTEAYLSLPVFSLMRKHGLGQVLSHWTWLPPLDKQFDKSGRRFFNAGGQAVIRLMTPIGLRYEEAYAKAHPFDKLVPGLLQPRMIADTVKLMRKAIAEGIQMNVIINNRSGGSAPLIAQELAGKFLASP